MDRVPLDGALAHMQAWPEPREWFRVMFAHHGKPISKPSDTELRDAFRTVPGYDWQAQEALIGQAMLAWFPAIRQHAPPPPMPRFAHFICGLVALADWVGSDRNGFGFVGAFDIKYDSLARERAERRVREIGLASGGHKLRGPDIWALLAPEYPEPHSAQEKVGGLGPEERLVILEAETGAGKTEAALWRYAALQEAGAVDALYFAVPTRAAARQLHARVTKAAVRLLDPAPEPVLAIPGQRVAGEATGTRLPDFETRWDDEEPRPARWAAEHATRFLAARMAVGTVDQVMLAGLTVKHAHLRGSALSRALLVIDEVHASDAYMTKVQCSLIRAHLDLGGHVMLMSATLGAAARAMWRGEDLPSLEAATAQPYPAVWTATECLPVDENKTGTGKEVAIAAQPGWSGPDAAMAALAAARAGARVLVIRNTVDRARETWTAVAEQAPELLLSVNGVPTLHHSRFAAEDRALLDRAVEEALGRDGRGGGCIVIGTQTLEQSLDIDADYLITDLCPMDVLLQRIGRLHRHARSRPSGFEAATVQVLSPPDGLQPLLRHPENGLGAGDWGARLSGVYVDVPVLAATLEQIEAHPIWRIPAMNRALVEAATHPEALDRLAAERGWEAFQQRVAGKALAEKNAAGLVLLNREVDLPEQFPDDEMIRTRLGDAGVRLRLPDGVIGPFGKPIRTLTLPPHWSHGLTGDEAVENIVAGKELIYFEITGVPYEYLASGLAKG
jgi:CRISPR-associated endonuclease/helicase Cas3